MNDLVFIRMVTLLNHRLPADKHFVYRHTPGREDDMAQERIRNRRWIANSVVAQFEQSHYRGFAGRLRL